MKKKIFSTKIIFVCTVLLMFFSIPLLSTVKGTGTKGTIPPLPELEKNVKKWMKAGKIPGLTLVIIGSDEPVFIKGYGYADLDKKTPVTEETLFELASCSKSFTALAALQLERKDLINLDSPVSDYFPWFYVTFNNQEYKITLRQLLHHTSGIPWESVISSLSSLLSTPLKTNIETSCH